jgi:hypothetical protein
MHRRSHRQCYHGDASNQNQQIRKKNTVNSLSHPVVKVTVTGDAPFSKPEYTSLHHDGFHFHLKECIRDALLSRVVHLCRLD